MPKKTLKDFYERLLNTVDTDMATKLNVPLTIVALLHLTNENNLILQQEKTNLVNFTIESSNNYFN